MYKFLYRLDPMSEEDSKKLMDIIVKKHKNHIKKYPRVSQHSCNLYSKIIDYVAKHGYDEHYDYIIKCKGTSSYEYTLFTGIVWERDIHFDIVYFTKHKHIKNVINKFQDLSKYKDDDFYKCCIKYLMHHFKDELSFKYIDYFIDALQSNTTFNMDFYRNEIFIEILKMMIKEEDNSKYLKTIKELIQNINGNYDHSFELKCIERMIKNGSQNQTS